MDLDALLRRCQALEQRAATLYRDWAARSRERPSLCSLWTSMAREEEEHERSLRVALRSPAPARDETVDVVGWEEAIAAVERLLIAAEELGEGATDDDLLAAALELEMSELETMRRALVAFAGRPARDSADHAAELARESTRLSHDPHVRLLATLLQAEARVKQQTL